MKKLIGIFVRTTFLIFLLVFTAFEAIAQERFRVGVIAPLSGALAEYGLAAKNGIELARFQNPELFDKIEFLYEDSQWDAKTSVSAFNRLHDVEKVSVVFNWGNPTTEAVAPIAEQHRLPLIGMTLDPRVAKGKKYVIRSTNSAADFSAIMAEHLVSKGYKHIGVVLADNTYVQGLFDGLQKELGNQAKLEIVDRYNIQDQDFRTTVSKMRGHKFDALGVFLISGQVSSFYRQLASQGISLPTFGTDFFESTTEIRLAQGGMNGAIYPHLGVSEEFRTAYVPRYGNDYQIAYAGNAHDMAIVLGRLFNRNSPAPAADEIMAQLRSIRDQTGVGGSYSFMETASDGPHYHFPVQLKKIDGETIKVVSMDNKSLDGSAPRERN